MRDARPSDPIDSTLRDRRGFALIAVLVVMVVLGFIGAASLTLTAGDQKVMRLFADANQADAAAGAGLEHGLALFQTGGAAAVPGTGSINGYTYTLSISPDTFDFNGDAFADTVYLAADGTLSETKTGEKVWLIQSVATKGSFRAVQYMRVAKRTLNVAAPGALTANFDVNLQGNITIDGRNNTINGTPIDPTNTANTGACMENKPAVMLTDSTSTVPPPPSATDLYCNPAFAGSTPTRCVSRNGGISYETPEQVLGLNPGDLESVIQDASTYTVPDSLSGLVYLDGNYGAGTTGGNTVNGSGVLIVHNPLYNPREHDPSDALYDASKASDPQYAPANLGNINGGTFRGLIIADRIEKINGDIDVIGAVVSLTEIDVTIVGAGTATIKYSCSALQQAGTKSTLPPTRLSWSAD